MGSIAKQAEQLKEVIGRMTTDPGGVEMRKLCDLISQLDARMDRMEREVPTISMVDAALQITDDKILDVLERVGGSRE